MSALKIVAGSVAVATAAVVGYKTLKHFQRKRAEKKGTQSTRRVRG